MQFDYLSMFGIREKLEEIEKKSKNMIPCPSCFCYVTDKGIVDKSAKFISHIEESFAKVKENTEVFRKMVAQELANHEAGYTGYYTDGLSALGLTFEQLTEEQKQIVKEELKKAD